MIKINIKLVKFRARGPEIGCCHRESRNISFMESDDFIGGFFIFLFSCLIMCSMKRYRCFSCFHLLSRPLLDKRKKGVENAGKQTFCWKPKLFGNI